MLTVYFLMLHLPAYICDMILYCDLIIMQYIDICFVLYVFLQFYRDFSKDTLFGRKRLLEFIVMLSVKLLFSNTTVRTE